ncbi:RNA-directed DNA polymerase from mobile element jockey [Trichonephila inaurata madagascariensis]|uniref:RNA-directed DNA polymerase from mobile element jockey n=1 Tax=Trichonephila inaurata madagascariensis TaxID=2747483 RepID=A0A8X7C070_9ARAC|nr:RNA-directed DNA polymerase from mobile element jockey [Trichonephila inaurata madagascariensis]
MVIPKGGKNSRFAENYRLISLISSLGKIFQKILLNYILKHCEENNRIPDFYHGFRQQTSTQHQPLHVTNLIINGFNNRTCTVGLFLDVKKAFDRIQRPILASTPQGSILSPALYNIYTCDFPTDDNLTVCLFAAADAIICNSSTVNEAVNLTQTYILKLQVWLTKWRVAINTEKTNAIVFRKNRSLNSPPPLQIFNQTIAWTFEINYLGLLLNDNLTYRPHFEAVTKNTEKNSTLL